jgi:hypothetical protein
VVIAVKIVRIESIDEVIECSRESGVRKFSGAALLATILIDVFLNGVFLLLDIDI